MDAGQSLEFPHPEPNDPQEVRFALETGAQLWSGDSRSDALLWLRRAAETAADAGDDLRSVSLARRAADLRSMANIAPSVPPGGASGPPPQEPPEADAATPPSDSQFNNPAQTVPATPAAGAAAALQAASQAAKEAVSRAESEPVVAQTHGANGAADAYFSGAYAADAVPAEGTSSDDANGAAAPASPDPAPESPDPEQLAAYHDAVASAVATEVASANAAVHAANNATPVEGIAAYGASQPSSEGVETGTLLSTTAAPSHPPSASLGAGFQTHHSVRVALGPKPNADGQFSVHPLAEGEPVDPGWTEALLVALVPGKRLFPGRR